MQKVPRPPMSHADHASRILRVRRRDQRLTLAMIPALALVLGVIGEVVMAQGGWLLQFLTAAFALVALISMATTRRTLSVLQQALAREPLLGFETEKLGYVFLCPEGLFIEKRQPLIPFAGEIDRLQRWTLDEEARELAVVRRTREHVRTHSSYLEWELRIPLPPHVDLRRLAALAEHHGPPLGRVGQRAG